MRRDARPGSHDAKEAQFWLNLGLFCFDFCFWGRSTRRFVVLKSQLHMRDPASSLPGAAFQHRLK